MPLSTALQATPRPPSTGRTRNTTMILHRLLCQMPPSRVYRQRDELVLFSYKDVLTAPKRRALVAEALTQEALQITRQFREDAFGSEPVSCAVTGVAIKDKTNLPGPDQASGKTLNLELPAKVQVARFSLRVRRSFQPQAFQATSSLTSDVLDQSGSPCAASLERVRDRIREQNWLTTSQARPTVNLRPGCRLCQCCR